MNELPNSSLEHPPSPDCLDQEEEEERSDTVGVMSDTDEHMQYSLEEDDNVETVVLDDTTRRGDLLIVFALHFLSFSISRKSSGHFVRSGIICRIRNKILDKKLNFYSLIIMVIYLEKGTIC